MIIYLNHTHKQTAHIELLRILEDFHLTQHQRDPSRLLDHDIAIADCNINLSQNKKEPRKIYNYKKADCDKIKQESSEFTKEI